MIDALRTASAWWREGRLLESCSRETWQARRDRDLRAHLERVARESPFYAGRDPSDLSSWPVVDKSTWMDRFDRINTAGLDRSTCLQVALRAEAERDFRPMVRSPGDGRPLTVGLSSGTSGSRGLFVASGAERALWAGVLLRRILPDLFDRRHRIALVLRSDSNLYRTLGAGHVAFRHHDLYQPWERLAEGLAAQDPTLLAAPPSVLGMLARRDPAPRMPSLRRILSIAEVLDQDVQRDVESTFGLAVRQIYQCTEGLLATPCPLGTMHLHEEHLVVEEDWLDAERTRYRPVITDFRRRIQPVVRYRLDDVLVPGVCDCGRHARALARVEGRCDDLVRLRSHDGSEAILFPDFARRLVLETLPGIRNWTLTQTALDRIELALPETGWSEEELAGFHRGWTDLCTSRNALAGVVATTRWSPSPSGAKLRRVVGLPVR